MQKTMQLLAVLLWALFVPVLTFAAGKKSSTEAYLEQLHNQGKERVIVTFKDEIDPNLITQYNAKLIRKLKIINAIVCEIHRNNINLLKRHSSIKDVAPDMLIRIPPPKRQPTDSTGEWEERVNEMMAPLSNGAEVRWENLEDGMNSQAAWDNYNLDGTGIKIAILDTGINYGNDPLWPMVNLDDNYLGGYDFVDDDNDPMPFIHPSDPDLTEWHGTSVASNCVGEGVSKIVGTAYNAGYYSVRILEGPEGTGLVSWAIQGIQWAMDPDGNPNTDDKADIINMSFGTYGGGIFWPAEKAALEEACNNAYNAGVILVAGSGNDGYDYSMWPARFDNVISAGAHSEDQTLWDNAFGKSNGGVDIVAPGDHVGSVSPENYSYWVYGTSNASGHASALIALQLQYARERGIEVNNGYLWEVMKAASVDLGIDPVYQGEGKIYAAQTDINDVNIGSIDLMASNWPIDYDFQFSDYAFIDASIPVYQIGVDVNQAITLTNITDTLGNTIENIENLDVNAVQVYYGVPNEPNLPGDSIKLFPTITLLEPNDANSITLSLLYTIPPETTPGLKKTKLELEFNFVGNSRVIKISYNEPNSFWYAAIPGDLELDDNVGMTDFSIFAQQWQETGCTEPNWCGRADMDQSGDVGWPDLDVLTEDWLTGL